MITEQEFSDLTKNAKVAWREGKDRVKPVARQLYDVTMTDKLNSEHSQIDGVGFARRKQPGQRMAQSSPVQGYSLLMRQQRVALSAVVQWELVKYDQYREIKKKLRELGQSTAKRMELDLTHLLAFGHAGTYTNMDGETVSCVTGDGLSIFNTAHTLTGSSATVSNKITAAFSRTGLEAAEALFALMSDNKGEKITSTPDTIVTSDDPTVVNTVKEFLRSVTAPETAERAIGVYYTKYNHIVLPYLQTNNLGGPDSTRKNHWMLVSAMDTDAILEISEEPTFTAPIYNGNGMDFDTESMSYKSTASYDYGVLDFKWAVGSDGTT